MTDDIDPEQTWMFRKPSLTLQPAAVHLIQGGGLAPLMTRVPAIGIHPAPRFTTAQITLSDQSCLYLFSDGAFETGPADGMPGRIEDLVALLPANPETAELLKLIRTRIDRRPFEDDVSLLRFRFA